MNPSQIEQIKILVNSSAVLSSQEKAEWLALLGLMNDRQLVELEKILTARNQESGIKNQGGPQALPKAAPIVTPPPQSKIPPLSHIMNLPKNFGAPHTFGQKTPSQGVTPEAMAKRILETKPTKQTSVGGEIFAKKLKSIFNEKELPVGNSQNQQKLSSPNSVAAPSSLSAVGPVVPVKPLPPIPPRPKNIIMPPLAKVQEKSSVAQLPQKRPVNNLASSPVFKGQDKAANFNPGITLTKAPQKITQDNLAEIKRHLDSKAANKALDPLLKEVSPLATVVGLGTLDSLVSLDLAALETHSLDSFVSKIRLLIKQHGYFDVIFNIEKSPAYKAYIETGLRLLSEQQNFEQLAGNGGSEQYLTREQFEKFTDLLAKIQTG